MNGTFRKLLLTLLFLQLLTVCAAQDTLQRITISPKLGSLMLKEKRESYRIFMRFAAYDYAQTFLSTSRRYYVRFWDEYGRDTLVEYSMQQIDAVHDLVEHFDEIKAGTFGLVSPPVLNPAEMTLSAMNRRRPLSSMIAKRKVQPEWRPDWGIGGGVTLTSGSLQGMKDAYDALAAQYAANGAHLPEYSIPKEIPTLLMLQFHVRFSERVTLAVLSANGNGDVVHYNLSGIVCAISPYILEEDLMRLSLFVSVGAAGFTCTADLPMSVQITSNNQTQSLEKVSISAGALGCLIGAGCRFAPTPSVCLSAEISVLRVRDVHPTIDDETELQHVTLAGNTMSLTLQCSFYP